MESAGPQHELYSTLEVSDTYSSKEVAPGHGDDLPQAVHPNGIPEYYAPKQHSLVEQYELPVQKEEKERIRKCGLAPRTFWIVVVVVSLGMIAAIAGGVAGGLLANRRSSDVRGGGSSSPSSSGDSPSSSGGGDGGGASTPGGAAANTTIPSTLLATSKVAAVNWTDTQKFSHYGVFWQDNTSAIMVSLWDSQNQTWSAVNISDAMAQSGFPVKAKPGTALSGVSTGPPDWPFQLNVYFLAPSNNIIELFTTDLGSKTWKIGDLTKSPKAADEGSPLGAVWHRCSAGCSEGVYVTYLSNNVIQVLNGSQWAAPQNMPEVKSGAGLALFPFTGFRANDTAFSPFGEDPELRLYTVYDGADGDTLGEIEYTASGDWTGGDIEIATHLPDNSGPPQIAGAPFHFWTNAQLTVLYGDGILYGTWFNGAEWKHYTALSVKGRYVDGFKAIAQHHERRLYAVVNGTVQEYRWEESDPMTLISVGEVALTP